MRKFIIAATAFIAAGMVSCNSISGDPTGGLGDLAAGVFIFEMSENQQTYAMDPFWIGFRLNTLLTEATAQDKLNDLGNVYVNNGITNVYLLSSLFPSTSIEVGENGVYALTYTNNAALDQVRSGLVTVDTGGTLLDDQETPVVWTIRASTGDGDLLSYNIDGETVTIVEPMAATMTFNVGSRSWSLRNQNFKCHGKTYEEEQIVSDWNVVFSVAQTTKQSFMYMDYLASTFDFAGTASGYNYYGATTSYSIASTNALRYSVDCGSDRPTQGKVTCKITIEDEEMEKAYPSDTVSVTWSVPSTGSCDRSGEVEYNGHSGTIG